MQQKCHFGQVSFVREFLLAGQYSVDGSSLVSSMLHATFVLIAY